MTNTTQGQYQATARSLSDLLNDDVWFHTATSDNANISGLPRSDVPPYHVNEPPPPPQPPPLQNTVTTVPTTEWEHDERQPPLQPYVTAAVVHDDNNRSNEHNHLSWKMFMFPVEEEAAQTYSSTEVLRLLQEHNDNFFCTAAMNKDFHDTRFCLLQANGGANTSVTNDPSILHTWWTIPPYKIGAISGGITCTRKGLFHLECTDGSVIPVQMYYAADATETVVSPTDIVFANNDRYDTWCKLQIANPAQVSCVFKQREDTATRWFPSRCGTVSGTSANPLKLRNSAQAWPPWTIPLSIVYKVPRSTTYGITVSHTPADLPWKTFPRSQRVFCRSANATNFSTVISAPKRK